MLTHGQIWSALDALAKTKKLSTSGLARNSGLDPTSFNKSKRFTAEGRERWPSTESVSKVLKSTGTTLSEFIELVEQSSGRRRSSNISYRDQPGPTVPLIGFAQAGVGGFFDDGGFPVGQGWEEISFPTGKLDSAYALQVSGDSMMPLYREGDVVIVDPDAQVRKGDRVIAKTRDGEVMAKLLERKTTKKIELKSINPDHKTRVFTPDELEWIARIIWASQ